MDINALLSPDDGAASSGSSSNNARNERSPSASSSPQRNRAPPPRPSLTSGKRTASGLSQEITRSPDRRGASPASNPLSVPGTPSNVQQSPAFQVQPGAIAAPNFRPLPPTSNPTRAPGSPDQYGYSQQQQQQYQQQRPVVAHRPSSTPQMETLADLASMQQRQQTTRTNSANSIKRPEPQGSPINTPLGSVAVASPPVARSISRQSLADLTMAEAPAQTPPPRDFTSHALTDLESQRVTELLGVLSENSYAYESHVELINLLHKGFLAHTYPPADSYEPVAPSDPYSYALLTEMRQARDAMDTRFAVGEDIWADWLADETTLARTTEERFAVTELCQRAVQDEPVSVKLWSLYLNWVSNNYAVCHNLEGADSRNWTSEDKEVCKELFNRDMLLTVLEQAVTATQWRMDESHLVWNRYAQAVQEEFPQKPSDSDIKRLHSLFVQRLQIPHLARDETMAMYWPLISRFEGNDYEATMNQVHQMAEPAKIHTNLRGDHEFKLQSAIQGGDVERARREFEKYLKSEKFHHKKPGPFDYDLRCALYERALLRFPTATDWWLDYVDFVLTSDPTGSRSLLPLVERATRHCPWSGDLWARRILRADVERKSREDIESTKHRATNAGLLDVGGMEELVKMLQQWCSYLRRHAFSQTATEDDIDTAEVGIIGALEDVSQAGKKLYGDEFQGDPLFRLEKIQMKFLSEARRLDEARDIYSQLSQRPVLRNSFDFWSQYYNWELWLWGYDRIREVRRVETHDNGPDLATKVCQNALKQRDLDWPEKALEMYLAHFQQHESGVRLQEALAEAREFSGRLAARRAREAEEAAATAAQQQQEYAAAAAQAPETSTGASGEKRKREVEPLTNGDGHKKAKTDAAEPHTDPSASASEQIKRDREHNTITLRNLPGDVEDIDIKKFFRDISNPSSINILRDTNTDSASATVEFDEHEDVLAAKTRNGKQINGREVHIQSGDQSTLYVTNYPAEYDENTIRGLFKHYGEIVTVRFPSLKYNSRRRFCYVQFLTAEMAKAAESAMDGKKLDGLHTLLAKISDPDAKKQRSGPTADGREIIVKNMHRDATEQEIKEIFSHYGTLEGFNLLRKPNNQLTGTGFFIYSSSDEATAAVEGANNKPLRDRILHVELSNKKGRAAPQERAYKEDVMIKKDTVSPEPNARRGSDVSMASAGRQDAQGIQNSKDRKIAIFNIPDTVNDARIRTAIEQYGPIRKIQLRRELGGAIVEMDTVKDAFNVKVGVDVSSLGPEAKTGDVGDLLNLRKQKKSKHPSDTNGSGSAPASTGSALAFVPSAASRPGQSRGGRRGGLGFKRGGGFASSARIDTDAGGAATSDGGKKSNSDFRSMLEASKKKEQSPSDGQ